MILLKKELRQFAALFCIIICASEVRKMIFGVGIDAVEVERIAKIVAKGDHFAEKVLTAKEFVQYQKLTGQRKIEYLGGRFSLKESFAKALGTGLGAELGLKDVETLWNEKGQPVTTSNKFAGKIFSSITHDNHEIITLVVLEN